MLDKKVPQLAPWTEKKLYMILNWIAILNGNLKGIDKQKITNLKLECVACFKVHSVNRSSYLRF